MKNTISKSFFKIHRDRILNIALISLSIVILLDIFLIILNITELTTAELELIVTSITGITTIVIIAWALNESRNSNRLLMYQNQIMMSQPTYDNFLSKISKTAEAGNESAIPETQLDILKKIAKFENRNISTSDYINQVEDLLQYISDNPTYNKYVKILTEKKQIDSNSINPDENNSLTNLATVMMIVTMGLYKTQNWVIEGISLYESVLHSPFLKKPQKQQLFLDLDNVFDHYIEICKKYKEHFTLDGENIKDELIGKPLSTLNFDYLKVKRIIFFYKDNKLQLALLNELTSELFLFYEVILSHKLDLSKLKE